MEYFIEGIAPLRYWYIKSNGQMRRVEYTKKNFFGVYLHQSLDRALSSRKYFIKALAKSKTSIIVLMEIGFL